jgi:uncharacterized protein (TIGR02246 family)
MPQDNLVERRWTMNRLAIWVACLGLLFNSSLALAGDESAIAAVSDRWTEAYAEGDTKAMLALYDENAYVFGTIAPERLDGLEAIRGYFDRPFTYTTDRKVVFRDPAIRFLGDDVAVNTGYYDFSYTGYDGAKKTMKARYSFTLVRKSGEWKIVDHHSSAVPTR